VTDSQRAVLQMLATSARGCSLSILLTRGIEMLKRLVAAGLAVAQRDAVGLSKTKVPHLRITAAGRKAIAEGALAHPLQFPPLDPGRDEVAEGS
jgi:hypothetical protein